MYSICNLRLKIKFDTVGLLLIVEILTCKGPNTTFKGFFGNLIYHLIYLSVDMREGILQRNHVHGDRFRQQGLETFYPHFKIYGSPNL